MSFVAMLPAGILLLIVAALATLGWWCSTGTDPLADYRAQQQAEARDRLDAIERKLLLYEFEEAERRGITVDELRDLDYQRALAGWGRLAERYIRAGLEPPTPPEPLGRQDES